MRLLGVARLAIVASALGAVGALSASIGGCGAGRLTPGNNTIGDASADNGGIPLDGDIVFDTGIPTGEGGFAGPVQISPNNALLFIDQTTGAPVSQDFKVTFSDGSSSTDITTDATFSIKPVDVGTFAGASFTSVTALPGGVQGVTALVSATTPKGPANAKVTLINIRKTPDASGRRDFFFTVPYKEAPTPPKDILKFGTSINKIDVVMAMDTTGSMTGEIDTLKATLTGSIIPALKAKIPDVGIAAVSIKDFDCDPNPVEVLQIVTTNTSLALAAVSSMSADGGCDLPEAQLGGMFYIMTGQADPTSNPPLVAHTPASGTWGGVDFRPGAVPVVVLISDANWHDPSGHASLAKTADYFNTKNAKFVGVFIGTGSDTSQPQGDEFSDLTHSNLPKTAFGGSCPTISSTPSGACRLNFAADSSGSGVDTSIVSAIAGLSVGSVYDIKAVLSNDPKNADSVDATQFVDQIRAMDEGSSTNGCAPHEAYASPGSSYKDTFKAVTVGDPICFEVVAKMNVTVAPKPNAQFFNAFIDMTGLPGNVDLGDRRSVVFLVPPDETSPPIF